MSSPKPVKPPTPGQAAQAALGVTGAGTMMDIANAPVSAYSNLVTNAMLDPYLSKSQTAVQGQAALQAAQTQQDIQAQLDPMARAQREMRLQYHTNKLGKLYGMDPSAFVSTGLHPSAYQTADLSQAPGLGQLTGMSGLIASALRQAKVDPSGQNPQLTGKPVSYGNFSGGGGPSLVS